MVYGSINQMKKVAMLAFEFPEFHAKLEFLEPYFKSKKVIKMSYISQVLSQKLKRLINNFFQFLKRKIQDFQFKLP